MLTLGDVQQDLHGMLMRGRIQVRNARAYLRHHEYNRDVQIDRIRLVLTDIDELISGLLAESPFSELDEVYGGINARPNRLQESV